MIRIEFADPALEELYEKQTTTDRRYVKVCRNARMLANYIRAINTIRTAEKTADLKFVSFLHYEKLKGRNQSSVRIGNEFVERLIFTESEDGIKVEFIEIDSNHYGKKR